MVWCGSALLLVTWALGLVHAARDHDGFLSTPELIRKYGYDVEEHQVVTEDGYILKMFRIPPRGKQHTNRVVFLQHAVLCSSSVYVLTGPAKGLGFLLAAAGYDVWMGNNRGTVYSKNHTRLSPYQPQYWRFSWHEIGVYDLPAELDYVLARTGVEKVYYVGHSMGTTMMYVLLSTRPEYNHRIRLFVSLSPVVFLSHMRSSLVRFFMGPLAKSLHERGYHEYLPFSEAVTVAVREICQVSTAVCGQVLFQVSGYDLPQLNRTMIPVICGHVPMGTSTWSMLHYTQTLQSGEFRQFDYGQVGNLEAYNSSEPPAYDLSLVTAPTAHYYSDNDWLADLRDLAKLNARLSNLVISHRVPYSAFNHMDYLFATDVRPLLYDAVLQHLGRF